MNVSSEAENVLETGMRWDRVRRKTAGTGWGRRLYIYIYISPTACCLFPIGHFLFYLSKVGESEGGGGSEGQGEGEGEADIDVINTTCNKQDYLSYITY